MLQHVKGQQMTQILQGDVSKTLGEIGRGNNKYKQGRQELESHEINKITLRKSI